MTAHFHKSTSESHSFNFLMCLTAWAWSLHCVWHMAASPRLSVKCRTLWSAKRVPLHCDYDGIADRRSRLAAAQAAEQERARVAAEAARLLRERRERSNQRLLAKAAKAAAALAAVSLFECNLNICIQTNFHQYVHRPPKLPYYHPD